MDRNMVAKAFQKFCEEDEGVVRFGETLTDSWKSEHWETYESAFIRGYCLGLEYCLKDLADSKTEKSDGVLHKEWVGLTDEEMLRAICRVRRY
jgi:hypothetical protein